MPPQPISTVHDSLATNTTDSPPDHPPAITVICAWPVSGQYGPGSRILFYVLIAACLIARKNEPIRNACLAGALLLPAVAALHAITLAALHNPDAVDLDIYGAFQLCALGILAAPLTARISRTYFNNPGRNIIFLWFGLIFAGLLSLTVEFLRTKTHQCSRTDSGSPLSHISDWNYGDTCGLTCSEDEGPFSPIRQDAANNIYVIPAPTAFTLGTATILCAACCIPPILSMVSMWNKILEINWRARFGHDAVAEDMHQPIEGTNNATPMSVKIINGRIRTFLSVVEAPFFGAAILAVLIIGERNFFSTQIDYQTEPIVSIGQWAPIVGTGLALFGSLYVALAATANLEDSHTDGPSRSPSNRSPRGHESPRRLTNDLTRTQTHATLEGTRRTVAGWLTTVAEYVGTPQKKSYDDDGFRRGRAMGFPAIPGEENRNPDLPRFTAQWTSRDPSREPSVRSRTSGTTRDRSNTADTLQLPSPTHNRPSRDSSNLPSPPQMAQITTSAREQSPPAIIVTPDPGSSDHQET
ncbi:hypothetical protein Q7P37_005337 [Cladosporium fusiforme]